jgi:hypothetical protein
VLLKAPPRGQESSRPQRTNKTSPNPDLRASRVWKIRSNLHQNWSKTKRRYVILSQLLLVRWASIKGIFV